MNVILPDVETRATFEIRAERPMDEEEFFEFCARNPELRIERNDKGEIIIIPPAGAETGFRNSDLTAQLANWSKRDGRGKAFDSNAEYILPDGAALSPDSSWVQSSRLVQFTKEQKKRFLPICPDFVVELISPTDRLPKAQAKRCASGSKTRATLGWLIDADQRTVYVYRPGREPEELRDIDHLLGDGIVEGFRLELGEIWRGL